MPLATKFNKLASSNQKVWISDDDFIAMQVEGQGLDAGRRVLELTGPLALAGMYVQDPSSFLSRLTVVDLYSSSPHTFPTISWFRPGQKTRSSTLYRVKVSHSRPTPINSSTTSTSNLPPQVYIHRYTFLRHPHPRRPLSMSSKLALLSSCGRTVSSLAWTKPFN